MKILIIAKHSKFEWEMQQLGLSKSELLKKLSREHANVDRILKAYEKQSLALNLMKYTFKGKADFIMMNELNRRIENYDIIISLGGDNSFTNISHYVENIPIMGINSDPERSVGYLTNWKINGIEDVENVFNSIFDKKFLVEQWGRIQAKVNGQLITPATSEYFVGEKNRTQMSRHIINYDNKEYEQKCSGLIIATAAGTTGWFKSAGSPFTVKANCANEVSFIATELYGSNPSPKQGTICGTEKLIINSLNDDHGIISVDSWEEYDFIRGSTIEISLANPLNVVVPNK